MSGPGHLEPPGFCTAVVGRTGDTASGNIRLSQRSDCPTSSRRYWRQPRQCVWYPSQATASRRPTLTTQVNDGSGSQNQSDRLSMRRGPLPRKGPRAGRRAAGFDMDNTRAAFSTMLSESLIPQHIGPLCGVRSRTLPPCWTPCSTEKIQKSSMRCRLDQPRWCTAGKRRACS